MPQAASHREEIMIGSEQIAILEAYDLYVDKNFDDKGNHKHCMNLTRAEFLGRKKFMMALKIKAG